jgi:hypothetical protein
MSQIMKSKSDFFVPFHAEKTRILNRAFKGPGKMRQFPTPGIAEDILGTDYLYTMFQNIFQGIIYRDNPAHPFFIT